MYQRAIQKLVDATWWDFRHSWIIIWQLIVYWFLFSWWINSIFCYSNSLRDRWIWTRINYRPSHPIICDQKLRNNCSELFWRFYLFFEVLFVPIHLCVLWSHSEVLSDKFDNSKKQTEVVGERNFFKLLFENFSNLKIEALPQLILNWKVWSIIRL